MWLHLGFAALLALVGVGLVFGGHPVGARLAEARLRKISELSEGMAVRLIGRLVASSTVQAPLALRDVALYQLEAFGHPEPGSGTRSQNSETRRLYLTTDFGDGLSLDDGSGQILLNPLLGEIWTATQNSRGMFGQASTAFPPMVPDELRGRVVTLKERLLLTGDLVEVAGVVERAGERLALGGEHRFVLSGELQAELQRHVKWYRLSGAAVLVAAACLVVFALTQERPVTTNGLPDFDTLQKSQATPRGTRGH